MATGPQGPGANDRIFPNLRIKELSADRTVASQNRMGCAWWSQLPADLPKALTCPQDESSGGKGVMVHQKKGPQDQTQWGQGQIRD